MNVEPREKITTPVEIWVMVIAAFVIAVGYGLIAPVLPQFARSFDVSFTAATIVVSIFAVFRLLFAPVGGHLADKLGERPVYIMGVLIVALSTLAVATANSYWQLIVYRGLGGIGSVMFTVSAAALIVRLAPPAIRGRVSSYYGGAFLLGNIVGPILGSGLAQVAIWVPFVSYGVALIIAAAVVAIFLSGARLRPEPGAPQKPVMRVDEAWQDSAFRSALGSSFANGWTNFGVRVAVLPLFADSISTEGWVAGAALTAFAVGNASILLFAGRITDRIGRKKPIITGLVISGSLTAVLGIADSVWLLIVLCALAGLGSGILNPAQQATVADIVGPDRSAGKVIATFMMLSDLGAIIGPIVVGLIVDTVGFGLGFALTGAMMLAAAVGWLAGRETAPTVAKL